MTHPTRPAARPFHRTLVAASVAALALVACGDDGDDAASADAATPVTNDAGVVDVVMDDFHYGDLPSAVPAGTRITVSNASEVELHEFVAFRLPDDDQRPVAEIVGGDLVSLLGDSEPAMVLLAPPGGEQIAAVGDGTLTDPGRYLVICVIPTGADPGEYLDAAATSDGPPQVAGGAPHVANGMYAELMVTG